MTDFAEMVNRLTYAYQSGTEQEDADALLTAISALERERDEAKAHRRMMLDSDLKMRTLVSLETDLAASQAALRKYGRHRNDAGAMCDLTISSHRKCTCGFEAALSTEGEQHE